MQDEESINFDDDDYIYEDIDGQSEVDSMRETGMISVWNIF